MNNKQHKHTLNEVAKGLRFRAFCLRFLTPKLSKRSLLILNHIQKVFYCKFPKGICKDTYQIRRDDGSFLKVYVLRKKQEVHKNQMGLIWFYSGGFLMGRPQAEKHFIKTFMKTNACVMILPKYRKSTKKPYPDQLNDGILTLDFCFKHLDMLKVNQIAVGGASAGGGLAQALCLYNKDHLHHPITASFSVYPMLNYQNNLHLNTFVWSSEMNAYAWKKYLNGQNEIKHYASPSLSTNLEGMPPMVSYVGKLDLFYEETLDYTHKLKTAHVKVDLEVYSGCFHAFDVIKFSHPISKKAHAFLTSAFMSFL